MHDHCRFAVLQEPQTHKNVYQIAYNFLGPFGFERPETDILSEVVLMGHQMCKITIPFGFVRNFYSRPGVETFTQNRVHQNTLSGSVAFFVITCGACCQLAVGHSAKDVDVFLADFCYQLVSTGMTYVSVINSIKKYF